MNDNVRRIHAAPGVPTTRRQLAYTALLALADDVLLARFSLVRALDKLSTEDVLEVLDEVGETVERQFERAVEQKVTQRDENPPHTR